jgi:leader peptidase (prepilin peptidase)/N-methyltransferase
MLALPVLMMGAAVGSFINVVVWRLPREESIIRPPSHCPRCGTRLAWFENLPVISWIVLAGRCRHCRRPIAPRYPLVEVLCAGLWLGVLLARPEAMGAAPNAWLLLVAGWLLVSWLLPLVLIDLDSLWLPEPLCRWGVVLGLAMTALIGFAQGIDAGRSLVLAHLIAAGLGLLGFEAVSAVAERIYGRPALGLGDAKLAALMGSWLGPAGLGVAVALAVVSGALVGGTGRLTGRLAPHQPLPFGPFLAIGAVAVWLCGHQLWIDLVGLGPLMVGTLA